MQEHDLSNVLFVSGTACGGKTTTSEYLANKYNLPLLNWDDTFPAYQALADPKYQPAMSKRPQFDSWEEYFMQPPAAFSNWIEQRVQEQLGMVIAQLIKMSGQYEGTKIIVDGDFHPVSRICTNASWAFLTHKLL